MAADVEHDLGRGEQRRANLAPRRAVGVGVLGQPKVADLEQRHDAAVDDEDVGQPQVAVHLATLVDVVDLSGQATWSVREGLSALGVRRAASCAETLAQHLQHVHGSTDSKGFCAVVSGASWKYLLPTSTPHPDPLCAHRKHQLLKQETCHIHG